MALVITDNRLELCKRDEPNFKNFFIDFTQKKFLHRIKSHYLKKEAIAKAIGIKKNYFPNVLDATAGLGKDSFILSALGCQVYMMERNPVISALLDDGLKRAYKNYIIGTWIKKRITLIHRSSFDMLNINFPIPDIIYLDPMYPYQKKSSLSKKENYFLRLLIGLDKDSDRLLLLARRLAKKRVIVKRPRFANFLSGIKTTSTIFSKKHRFDIYLPFYKK
ncbi:MAG TPA: class I SAM-dependent methyltransferase [Buchnera sp. (in: enterobacteria)]|nr:class I SAM-dependent methyltransferase [Buchnera sp. (in: enterobacteria)]